MCGIAGIFHREGGAADAGQLRRMVKVLAHRGQDDEGLWCEGPVGLGHRRLSIVDLSSGGHQPMTDSGRGLHLVFNGEIHNYPELRVELQQLGFRFHSASDTEVVLAAYAAWGEDCFPRFNGMWAIALWDARAEALILSRDRFGIKPLVYALEGEACYFASEAKSLLAADSCFREPNWRAVSHYLDAMVTDIGPETFFKRIRSLPCGHTLRITAEKSELRKHWAFVPGEARSGAEVEERFRALLTDAVRLRRRSDARLGVWLSGGLDSSVIAGLTAMEESGTIPCFSLRYPDHPQVDESEYVRAMLQKFPNLDVQWVTPDLSNLLETLACIVRAHDAPPVARGRYAAWHLARETVREVDVVLSGDGADELLGGYQTFAAPYAVDRLFFPGPEGRLPLKTIRQEYDTLIDIYQPGSSAREVMLRGLRCGLGLGGKGYPSVCTPAFWKAYGPANPHHRFSSWASTCGDRPCRSFLNNALWREFWWRGLPEMMKGFDAISMAHTLEMRSPFLDHRVVEFCFSLPYYEKISKGTTKQLLRRAFADLLPSQVAERRRKLGFPSPLHQAFGRREIQDRVREFLLDGDAVRLGVFDPKLLEQHLQHFREHALLEKTPRQLLLWVWYCVEAWIRQTQRVETSR